MLDASATTCVIICPARNVAWLFQDSKQKARLADAWWMAQNKYAYTMKISQYVLPFSLSQAFQLTLTKRLCWPGRQLLNNHPRKHLLSMESPQRRKHWLIP